ncbi:SusC/RagA family TonB-linked outer membrane protein [Algoriphagus sp. H41]|uniref:SusC/RagA family TonB-linked outer membrane protein n=1 Tax=Algoriphagus oliviformis TaxID=2811231 RepID=A0ABS3C8D3_9BACT|nr:SusC/RagA family TonB-linked outer membrane protein [Algoriphagus oliviformis]MBN7813090.1 SusC/RagA family TonB-linked outer membrane protein [Algoriphagus oliviformis]
MKKFLILFTVVLYCAAHEICGQALSALSGVVTDSRTGAVLEGAFVTAEPGRASAVADAEGRFVLSLPVGGYELTVQSLGYATLKSRVDLPTDREVKLSLEPLEMGLEEVQVLATGYQEIPKNRASGSFVQLDQELVTRRVSTGFVDRLEDVTSGLIINRTGDTGRDPITIRGRSTLGRYSQPLVVIDNFPFDGSLDDINPNDIASVTVLRDAAAASIWGARAGNGVIVVTTKSGRREQPLQASLSANANWIQHPDPFLAPNLSVSDFINVERQLFSSGFYNTAESSLSNPVLSPVVETLILARDGVISQSEADSQIARLGGYDLRDYLDRDLYQTQLNQQYSLGLAGGGKHHAYRIGLGLDENRESRVGDRARRVSVMVKNDLNLLKDRLQLQTAIFGVKTTGTAGGLGPEDLMVNSMAELYPYSRLSDENGNPLAVSKDYRESFKRQAEENGLLDWAYVPLGEIGLSPEESQRDDWRLNLGGNYRLAKGLKAAILYQYWQNQGRTETVYSSASYFARNLVNSYTQSDASGRLSYPIPKGGIYDWMDHRAYSHTARAQLDYEKSWKEDWTLNLLGGAEVKSHQATGLSGRYYGFNPELYSSQAVDYTGLFSQYYAPQSSARIPNRDGQTRSTDRFTSLFANGALVYQNRYLLTLSARKDASNLFGVEANQKAVPLWSAGLGWTLSGEDFYRWKAMPFVKLRLSYGYNGNVDRSLSAFTTARTVTFNPVTQIPYSQIVNPPNENLRWERIRIFNAGLDFETRSGRLAGTFEAFRKQGVDLIGTTPYAPSTGISTFTGNNAAMLTTGYDLSLESQNLGGQLSWSTVFLLSGVREEVTAYENEVAVQNLLLNGTSGSGGTYFPVVGKPLFAVYSLPWEGLNPDTGAPVGLLDGEPSEDYRAIINSATLEEIIYHGPARPTVFGSLRNTLAYRGFSLSANISYRFGYYFRRSSVQYETILQGLGGHSDYALRWQNPGDEMSTQVPSQPAARDAFRDQFYRSSSVLVEKGDHIRLQDIRLGYRLPLAATWTKSFRNAELFLYANNLAMLWKSTETDWDPDFGASRPLKSIAVGINLDF